MFRLPTHVRALTGSDLWGLPDGDKPVHQARPASRLSPNPVMDGAVDQSLRAHRSTLCWL